MQSLIKHTYYAILLIFIVSAGFAFWGLSTLWSGAVSGDLPYLKTLVTMVIVEAAGVVIGFAKLSTSYIPKALRNKTTMETKAFMLKFLSEGSSATVVTNRLSWIEPGDGIMRLLEVQAKKGVKYQIITPQPVRDDVRQKLEEAGVKFFVTSDAPPEARFTLLNGDRAGAERLAIARGAHPDHEISIFDNSSGPQIIALAKDIIRKSVRSNV